LHIPDIPQSRASPARRRHRRIGTSFQIRVLGRIAASIGSCEAPLKRNAD